MYIQQIYNMYAYTANRSSVCLLTAAKRIWQTGLSSANTKTIFSVCAIFVRIFLIYMNSALATRKLQVCVHCFHDVLVCLGWSFNRFLCNPWFPILPQNRPHADSCPMRASTVFIWHLNLGTRWTPIWGTIIQSQRLVWGCEQNNKHTPCNVRYGMALLVQVATR